MSRVRSPGSGQGSGRGPGVGPVGRGPGAMASRAGMPAAKSADFAGSGKRLLSRLKPESGKLVVVAALAVLSVLASVLGPKLLGEAVNLLFSGWISGQLPAGVSQAQAIANLRAQGQGQIADLISGMTLTPGAGMDFGAIGHVLLFTLALYVVSALLGYAQAFILNGVTQRTVYRLRQDVEAKIHRLPLKYFDGMQRGEMLSRVTNDIDNVAQSLQQTLSQALTSLLMLIGVLVMMFVVSPLMALIVLVSVPVLVLVTVFIAKRSQKMFVAQWKYTGELNAHIEEAFTGHALVKVFGRHREVQEQFNAKNQQMYQASIGGQFLSGLIMPAMTFVGNLLYVVIAVVGGLRVASGSMQLGDVTAFIQYSRQFTQPLTQLGSMANLVQSGVASAERVFELLDAKEETADPAAPAKLEGTQGRVVFDHVSFGYDAEKPLIHDLNLEAKPGQTVAIVGPTGAGKTTLVNLMMRFYDVDQGQILLDGVNIESMSRADLRSRISMVLQDTWLFNGTIRENIAYGRPDATEAEILAAAESSYVDRFVRSLPEGYDAVLDDEGSNVSAGEKQLLTIARAFLARPSVLILDEATSSVDTRTEVLVQKAMNALRENRTSFVIAHRLSTIRDADLIVVMDHGAIVEQGTHSELLALGGAYYTLYYAQFSEPEDAA